MHGQQNIYIKKKYKKKNRKSHIAIESELCHLKSTL